MRWLIEDEPARQLLKHRVIVGKIAKSVSMNTLLCQLKAGVELFQCLNIQDTIAWALLVLKIARLWCATYYQPTT